MDASRFALVGLCTIAIAVPAPRLWGRSVADEVGIPQLIARVGKDGLPTGAGVVVSQVEAPENGNYSPDQANAEFVGKTFTLKSGPTGVSGHATTVGKNMYGLTTSVAPGVTNIFLYEALSWATTGYLRTGQGALAPLATPGGIKMFNNSWIGSFGSTATDNECLRRADFVITRDSLLIFNGVNNGGPQSPLMAYMFNGVSVGVSAGTHTSGPVPAGYDGSGRMKPEIVSPEALTSFATPIVDAVTALLVETAKTQPGLSTNANALRSETLKAVLLAGAKHRAGWTNNPSTSGPNRGVTFTPLDAVYGVDLVNVDRSHLILTGLEQDGATSPPGTFNVINRGWDMISVPGSASRYYRFHVGVVADKVSILATWHRKVASNFLSYTLGNFTLTLWRVDGGNLVTLVGDPGLPYFGGGNVVSQSSVDNIEHLYITDLQPGDYAIELKRVDAVGSVDAGIAWLLPQRTGDTDGDGFVDVDDLLDVINDWGLCPDPCPPHCAGDLTGDCAVDVDDLLVVINNWG